MISNLNIPVLIERIFQVTILIKYKDFCLRVNIKYDTLKAKKNWERIVRRKRVDVVNSNNRFDS